MYLLTVFYAFYLAPPAPTRHNPTNPPALPSSPSDITNHDRLTTLPLPQTSPSNNTTLCTSIGFLGFNHTSMV